MAGRMKWVAPNSSRLMTEHEKADHRRTVVAGGEPLVGQDDHEQRGHGELDAPEIKGQHRACHRADDAADDPVAVVKGSDEEINQPRSTSSGGSTRHSRL